MLGFFSPQSFNLFLRMVCICSENGISRALDIPSEVRRLLCCSLMPLAGKVFPSNFWIFPSNDPARGGYRYVLRGRDGRIDIKFEPDFMRLTISMRISHSPASLPLAVAACSICNVENVEVPFSHVFRIGDVVVNRRTMRMYVINSFRVYFVPPKVAFCKHPITGKRTVRNESMS